MAYVRHRKHRYASLNQRPRGIPSKNTGGMPPTPVVLSAQDVAALANMQPVTIRTIMATDRYPLAGDGTGDGWMGEYSIRSCNNNRPRR